MWWWQWKARALKAEAKGIYLVSAMWKKTNHRDRRIKALARKVRALKKELRTQLKRIDWLKRNQRFGPSYQDVRYSARLKARLDEQHKEVK